MYNKHTISLIFLSTCLFSGCVKPPHPPPNPVAQWNSFVVETEKGGYQLMSVQDSQNWINGHIFDSYELEFLQTLRVSVITNGVREIYIITVDYNSKPRVFKPSPGGPGPAKVCCSHSVGSVLKMGETLSYSYKSGNSILKFTLTIKKTGYEYLEPVESNLKGKGGISMKAGIYEKCWGTDNCLRMKQNRDLSWTITDLPFKQLLKSRR